MGDTPQKRCSGCPEGEQWHPATTEFFYRSKSQKDGLDNYCKACKLKSNGVYRSRPEWLEQSRNYAKEYQKRPEVREYNRTHKRKFSSTPEYRERRRAYFGRPEIRARRQKFEQAYRQRPENRERLRSYDVHRRARERDVLGTHTPTQIQALLKRQRHKCYYCSRGFQRDKGKYIFHVEHTFPLSRVAGTDIPANDINYLVLACPTCNHNKKDKFPWEFPEGGRLL